jgi:hypothetical protein
MSLALRRAGRAGCFVELPASSSTPRSGAPVLVVTFIALLELSLRAPARGDAGRGLRADLRAAGLHAELRFDMIQREAVPCGARGRAPPMDTITEAGPDDAGEVVVSGSHGGTSSGSFALAAPLRLAVFNDAGVGKDEAGIAALAMLQAAAWRPPSPTRARASATRATPGPTGWSRTSTQPRPRSAWRRAAPARCAGSGAGRASTPGTLGRGGRHGACPGARGRRCLRASGAPAAARQVHHHRLARHGCSRGRSSARAGGWR